MILVARLACVVIAASAVAQEVNCLNNLDDDSDRLIDCLDSDCAPDSGNDCSSCTAPLGTLPDPTLAPQFQSGAIRAASPGAFYQFLAPRGVRILFTTCDPGGASFDSVIEVLAESCTQLARNDDSCGLRSRVIAPAPIFDSWRVLKVRGFSSGTSGTFVLAYRALVPESGASACANGLDDDDDSLVDCADPECGAEPACREVVHCSDGLDNDLDGRLDCSDPDCWGIAPCREIDGCNDGRDNDGDLLIDCHDPDCAAESACREADGCDDGRDNDYDGWVDCADADCAPDAGCLDVVRPDNLDGLRVSRSGSDIVLTVPEHQRDIDGEEERVAALSVYRGSSGRLAADVARGTNRLLANSPGAMARDVGAATDGAAHYYVVTAVDAWGNEGNGRSATLAAGQLTGSWQAPGDVILTWTPALPLSRLAGYRLYGGRYGGPLEEVLDLGMVTSWQSGGTPASGTWRFAVSAVDVDGNETALDNDLVVDMEGIANISAVAAERAVLWGPAAGLGLEPRALVTFPPGIWTRATMTVTLASDVGPGCDCASPTTCAGDTASRRVDVFLVGDAACTATDASCVGWDLPRLELMRAMTPLGTDARTGPRVLSVDVTPFLPMLIGTRWIAANVGAWSGPGWTVSVAFRLSEDPADASPTPPAAGVLPVVAREGVVADNQDAIAPTRVTIPPGVREVRMRLFVSGEGSGDPVGRPECSGPADEFCRKTNRLIVDGVDAWSADIWRDCSASCAAWNACGAGDCELSRAGWCPGEVTCYQQGACDQDVDVTAAFPPGSHDVLYVVDDPTPGGSWGYALSLYYYY